ncbi:MAG: hypothetical protein KAK00_09455 [Nanoarchaeota archaeon]|nr:hypothetical protein [Nanoarchaeota archaeon]
MGEEIIILSNGEYLLLKRAIAKILYKNNYEQSKISKILKLTQPRVSNYISSNIKIPKNIKGHAEKIIEKINNKHPVEFSTCITFSEKHGNYFLADKNELISNEKQKIIDNLTDAFLLLKGKDITNLLPQIKMNIAMSTDNPKSRDEIASFSNGFIIMDNKISSTTGIKFGKSKHLSSLLTYLKSENSSINAIMNIKLDNKLLKSSFRYSYFTKNYKLKEKKKHIDILLHKGGFGIEPCAYIIGKDAIEAAKKVIKLIEEV